MPKGTRVHRCVNKLKKTYSIGHSIAICQKSTKQNYKTGKKLRKKKKTQNGRKTRKNRGGYSTERRPRENNIRRTIIVPDWADPAGPARGARGPTRVDEEKIIEPDTHYYNGSIAEHAVLPEDIQPCLICQEDLINKRTNRKCPTCNRVFHYSCLGKWFYNCVTGNTCPNCRAEWPRNDANTLIRHYLANQSEEKKEEIQQEDVNNLIPIRETWGQLQRRRLREGIGHAGNVCRNIRRNITRRIQRRRGRIVPRGGRRTKKRKNTKISKIVSIFKQYPNIFPRGYFRFLESNLEERIKNKEIIFKNGVVLTWKIYKKNPGRYKNLNIQKGDVKIHQFVNKNEGNGKAKKIFLAFLNKHNKTNIVLDVRSNNKRAIRFYKKNGFKKVGNTKFGDLSGIIMRRKSI